MTEAAVVGSPDPVRGEIVKAFVILAPGYKHSEKLTKELQEHVKKVTAPYKYPMEIEYVKTLPKTISRKIKRKEHYIIFAESFKKRAKDCCCFDLKDIHRHIYSSKTKMERSQG